MVLSIHLLHLPPYPFNDLRRSLRIITINLTQIINFCIIIIVKLGVINTKGGIMKSKGIFITSTGTGMGKTYISALLVKKLLETGVKCGYYKPVLSGGVRKNNGSLKLGDCEYVIRKSGLKAKPQDCVTYAFEGEVSPHFAAKRLKIKVKVPNIVDDFTIMSLKYPFVVVEGAGGIASPLKLQGKTVLLSHVIQMLGLDMIIVADAGLGTLNSVLLTVEWAKVRSLPIKGIILNYYDPENLVHVDNREQIEKLTGIKVVATVQKGDKDINISKKALGL